MSTTAAGLMTIPRELRDMIFGYLILKPTNTITMLGNFQCHKNEISASPPTVCFVNWQLREETLPSFYSNNTFSAQLDNDQDLGTALFWLHAIGDENIGHLRRLLLCGWARIPFGHMVIRRWIRIVLNLKEGTMEVSTKEGDCSTEAGSCLGSVGMHDDPFTAFEELRESYQHIVQELAGETFDLRALSELMTSFNLLCNGY